MIKGDVGFLGSSLEDWPFHHLSPDEVLELYQSDDAQLHRAMIWYSAKVYPATLQAKADADPDNEHVDEWFYFETWDHDHSYIGNPQWFPDKASAMAKARTWDNTFSAGATVVSPDNRVY